MKPTSFKVFAVLYVCFVVLSFLTFGLLDALSGAVSLSHIFSTNVAAPYVLQQDVLNFLSIVAILALLYCGVRLRHFLSGSRRTLMLLIVASAVLTLSIISYDVFWSWFPYYSDFYRIFFNAYVVGDLAVALLLVGLLRRKV